MSGRQEQALASLERLRQARIELSRERFIRDEPVAFKVIRRAREASAYVELVRILAEGAAEQVALEQAPTQ